MRKYGDLSLPEQMEQERRWGDHNTIPEGWEPITEAQLIRETWWASEHPDLIETRLIPVGNGEHHATLYFYHDRTGVGMMCYRYHPRIRWFRFGCVHEFRAIPATRRPKTEPYTFLHAQRCQKCSFVRVVDSSG